MKTLIPSPKEWATEQLDLEKAFDKDSALLKFVEDENFLLNDHEAEALGILSENHTDGLNSHYHEFVTKKIHKEISLFRESFFSMSIQERRDKLKDLETISGNSISCKSMLFELRIGAFIDISSVPEENKAKDFVTRFFTSSPQNRSMVLDEVANKTELEKKELHEAYLELGKIDEDILRLCPQLEYILNPPVVEEVTSKKKTRKRPKTLWLLLIIAYLLYKIISLGVERSQAEETDVPEPKEKPEKVVEPEKDKFLEYMEEKEKEGSDAKEKSNE